MKLANYIILISAMLSAGACNKYLDKKSSDDLLVPTTLKDLQLLMQDADMMNRSPSYPEMSSDDYFISDEIFAGFDNWEKSMYLWQHPHLRHTNEWGYMYAPVYTANLALEGLNKIERTPANNVDYDKVKGAALFFRSYHLWQIATTFAQAYDEETAGADYGIVLRTGSDFNVPSKRASVEETYQKIIFDAMESMPLLPDHPSVKALPSKGAVYGLLARVYLSMRKYDSAAKYSGMCLTLNNELINYNEIDVDAASPFQALNKETIFYSCLPYSSSLNTGVALIDTVLIEGYADDDLRKRAFLFSSGDYVGFKGSYTGTSNLFSGITSSEMYMTRAECYARAGSTQPAMDDLNEVLSNRWVAANFIPFTAASANEALTLVLAERRKELLFRGLRWIDVKRLNKENAGISFKRNIDNQEYLLSPNNPRFALTLPDDIILLTGMPQNPGWE